MSGSVVKPGQVGEVESEASQRRGGKRPTAFSLPYILQGTKDRIVLFCLVFWFGEGRVSFQFLSSVDTLCKLRCISKSPRGISFSIKLKKQYFTWQDREKLQERGDRRDTCSSASPLLKPSPKVGAGSLNPGPCTWCCVY